MTEIAVVIPTYNNLPELQQCLEALQQQTYRNFTAYVCVDGSTDGTFTYVKDLEIHSLQQSYKPPFIRALVHPDGRNHGRNATRNLALPYLSAHDWVAFLDSDSCPLPDWLERFIEADPLPNEVLLGAILYFSTDNPNPWQRYLAWRERRRAYALQRSQAMRGYFRYFVTGNAFLPSLLLLQAKGMDTQIRRHGLGDVELGYRLQALGCTFRYVPQAKVWSAAQQTPYQALSRLYQMGIYNLPYLHKKHPESRRVLFGGRWLLDRWRRQLLQLFLQPFWARRVLAALDKLPEFLQRWSMRYLVLYAVARGFWKKGFALPPPQRERPV